MTTATRYRRDERRPVDAASRRCHEIFNVNAALRTAGVPMKDMARMQLDAIHALALHHPAWSELRRPAPDLPQPTPTELVYADDVPVQEQMPPHDSGETAPTATAGAPAPAEEPVGQPEPTVEPTAEPEPAPAAQTSRADHLAELAEKRREARLRRRMARIAAEEGDL
ncbi:MAG: hypothetical protein L0K27_02655 [Corynebacterium nuruki]|nr:hypothetical protein [Corynebacterium nuruki]